MSVIALAAVGFTMQFGITNMINLAYGQVMIASAYVAYYLNRAGVTIWAGMIAGAVFGAFFSFLLNRFVYAPFQRKGTSLLGMVIVSLAVSLMIANLLLSTLTRSRSRTAQASSSPPWPLRSSAERASPTAR